jgi:hypothetical protein
MMDVRQTGSGPDILVLSCASVRTIEHAYGLSYLGAASESRSGSLPLGSH